MVSDHISVAEYGEHYLYLYCYCAMLLLLFWVFFCSTGLFFDRLIHIKLSPPNTSKGQSLGIAESEYDVAQATCQSNEGITTEPRSYHEIPTGSQMWSHITDRMLKTEYCAGSAVPNVLQACGRIKHQLLRNGNDSPLHGGHFSPT